MPEQPINAIPEIVFMGLCDPNERHRNDSIESANIGFQSIGVVNSVDLLFNNVEEASNDNRGTALVDLLNGLEVIFQSNDNLHIVSRPLASDLTPAERVHILKDLFVYYRLVESNLKASTPENIRFFMYLFYKFISVFGLILGSIYQELPSDVLRDLRTINGIKIMYGDWDDSLTIQFSDSREVFFNSDMQIRDASMHSLEGHLIYLQRAINAVNTLPVERLERRLSSPNSKDRNRAVSELQYRIQTGEDFAVYRSLILERLGLESNLAIVRSLLNIVLIYFDSEGNGAALALNENSVVIESVISFAVADDIRIRVLVTKIIGCFFKYPTPLDWQYTAGATQIWEFVIKSINDHLLPDRAAYFLILIAENNFIDNFKDAVSDYSITSVNSLLDRFYKIQRESIPRRSLPLGLGKQYEFDLLGLPEKQVVEAIREVASQFEDLIMSLKSQDQDDDITRFMPAVDPSHVDNPVKPEDEKKEDLGVKIANTVGTICLRLRKETGMEDTEVSDINRWLMKNLGSLISTKNISILNQFNLILSLVETIKLLKQSNANFTAVGRMPSVREISELGCLTVFPQNRSNLILDPNDEDSGEISLSDSMIVDAIDQKPIVTLNFHSLNYNYRGAKVISARLEQDVPPAYKISKLNIQSTGSEEVKRIVWNPARSALEFNYLMSSELGSHQIISEVKVRDPSLNLDDEDLESVDELIIMARKSVDNNQFPWRTFRDYMVELITLLKQSGVLANHMIREITPIGDELQITFDINQNEKPYIKTSIDSPLRLLITTLTLHRSSEEKGSTVQINIGFNYWDSGSPTCNVQNDGSTVKCDLASLLLDHADDHIGSYKVLWARVKPISRSYMLAANGNISLENTDVAFGDFATRFISAGQYTATEVINLTAEGQIINGSTSTESMPATVASIEPAVLPPIEVIPEQSVNIEKVSEDVIETLKQRYPAIEITDGDRIWINDLVQRSMDSAPNLKGDYESQGYTGQEFKGKFSEIIKIIKQGPDANTKDLVITNRFAGVYQLRSVSKQKFTLVINSNPKEELTMDHLNISTMGDSISLIAFSTYADPLAVGIQFKGKNVNVTDITLKLDQHSGAYVVTGFYNYLDKFEFSEPISVTQFYTGIAGKQLP